MAFRSRLPLDCAKDFPGLAFCIQLAQRGARFLTRVKESFYREEFGSVAKDGRITLVVTKHRAQQWPGAGNPLPVGTVLRLRVIKITLANGNQEILMTNVPTTLLPYRPVEAVYHLRWGVETPYDILKNDWELENFSGIRPEVIAQEHQATVVTSNLAALVEHEAQRRRDLFRDQGKVHRNMRRINLTRGSPGAYGKTGGSRSCWTPIPTVEFRRIGTWWNPCRPTWCRSSRSILSSSTETEGQSACLEKAPQRLEPAKPS